MSPKYSLLIMLILLAACSSKPSITGEWKLAEIKMFGQMSDSALHIDVSDPEGTKKRLDSFSREKLPPEEYDRQEIESEIDTLFAYARLAGLRISSNREFGMVSYGLIAPRALPGWHFGDRLFGEWDLNNDTLALTIGDEERAYTFRYTVLEKTSKKLKLRETTGDGHGDIFPGSEITFIRK